MFQDPPRLARRTVLGALGAVFSASWLGACTFRPRKTSVLAEAEGPLTTPEGTWRVAQVMPPVGGAIPVLMQTPAGRSFQVDLLRVDPGGPRGVAETPSFALYLANRGRGDTPSQTDELRGAALLARRLAALEAERGAPPVVGLLTMSQRVAAHARSVLTPWS